MLMDLQLGLSMCKDIESMPASTRYIFTLHYMCDVPFLGYYCFLLSAGSW